MRSTLLQVLRGFIDAVHDDEHVKNDDFLTISEKCQDASRSTQEDSRVSIVTTGCPLSVPRSILGTLFFHDSRQF